MKIVSLALSVSFVAAPAFGQVEFAKRCIAEACARPGAAKFSPDLVAFDVMGVDKTAPDNAPFGPESYFVGSTHGHTLLVMGGDERGAMYGGLDVADAIAAGRDPFQSATTFGPGGQLLVHRPFLRHRQFKLNLPLAGTGYLSAEALQHNSWFWDEKYWDDFLDLLARSRFNTLSLWSAHPYPQMVKLDKFPEVQDVSKEQLEKNVALFHSIFRKARARGIEPMLVTWNVHVSPTFAKAHSIGDSGVDGPLVRDYMKECVRALFAEYPELAGIGTCPGEAMPQDAKGREEFIRDCYLGGIAASGRKDVFFLQRYWGGDPPLTESIVAADATSAHVPMLVSVKFNGEHMYSWPSPHFFDPRWIEQTPRDYDVIWHLRNDDLFLLRWGDPDFARATVRSCRQSGVGFLTGSEIWIDGADYVHTDTARQHVTWKWDFDRLWLRYHTWGRLGYDPDTPDSKFEELFAARFGPLYARSLFTATREASRWPTLVTGFHWNYMNGDWYPEGCVGSWVTGDEFHRGRNLRLNDTIFHDVLEFVFNHTVDDDLVSIPEYVAHRLAGDDDAKIRGTSSRPRRTPFDVAEELERHAAAAEAASAPFQRSAGGELGCTLADLDATTELARYYAEKIRGAAHLALHFAGVVSGVAKEQELAVAALERAAQHWTNVARIGDTHYREHEVWLMGAFSWSRYAKDVARDVEIARKAKSDADGVRHCRAFQLPYDSHFDFNTLKDQLALGVAPFDPPPPLLLGDATNYVEAEEFVGPWREQTNYPGFRGRGFRCSTELGRVATTSLRRTVEVSYAGKYTIWVRGLVGHATDPNAERSVQAFLDGQPLEATQTKIGGEPHFTWEKAGERELGAGLHTLELRDHGPGYEHVDCVAISRDETFDPTATCSLPPILPDGRARYAAALESVLQRELARARDGGPLAVPGAPEQARSLQRSMHDWFARAIGLDRDLEVHAARRCPPLNTQRIGELELGPHGDVVVEKIVFESRPKFYVPAHVWRPRDEAKFAAAGSGRERGREENGGSARGGPRLPAVVVPVGHWMQEGKLAAPMQTLGQALARAGYVALIYDPIDEGERRVPGMSHRLALPLMTAGECDLTHLLWDTIRAIDVLCERDDVDPDRIAVTGCSGAGMNTCYTAFLDERVKAAAPSCYFSTFEAILAAGNHCEDNYIPGILELGNMADFTALALPRPLISLSATHDGIFPVEPTKAAVARLNRWAAVLGAPTPMELFFDDSPHDYSRAMHERCVGFLERHLRGRADAPDFVRDVVEPTLVPFDDPKWQCLPHGMPKDAKSLLDLTNEAIERELAKSPGTSALGTRSATQFAEAKCRRARELLAWRDSEAKPIAAIHVEHPDPGWWQQLDVSGLGFDVDGFPCTAVVLALPSSEPRRLDVVVDDRPIHALLADADTWNELAHRVLPDRAVVLVEPSGRGETAGDEEHAWRLLTECGRPLLGVRAVQVAAVARALAKQHHIRPAEVTISGRWLEGGLLALLTSVCSSLRFGGATGSLASFREIPTRFDAAPALCVPRLTELGDRSDLVAIAEAAWEELPH